MKNRKLFSLLLLAVTALLIAGAVYASERFDPQKVYGPRFEKLCMLIMRDADSQVLAVQKGEVDILSDITRPSDIDRLSRDEAVSMSLARGFHAFFLLLNNKAEPWNNKYVRQAAAEAIDRNNIVRTIYSGYCEPITTWIPPVSPWAVRPDGRLAFNRASSREKLKSQGYSWNVAGHLVAPDGRALPKLKLLAPLARVAPTTAELAEQIADALNSVGFPVEVEPMDFSAMVGRLDRKDYSLAVLAWGMGRNPNSLYSFYHSEMDVDGGYNITGISDPELDEALYSMAYAKTKEEAEAASEKSQRLLADLVPSIPVYSRFSVASVSKKLKNVLMTDTVTADNIWTILMAEPSDPAKKVLNMALAEDPGNMNVFVASSAYTWQVLGMIYEGMIGTDPFTLEDMPALAESWKVETVHEKGAEKTRLEFRFRPGLKWNDGTPLTAHDMKATIKFLKKHKIPRFYDYVNHVEAVYSHDDGRLIVQMDNVSYWNLDKIGGLPCIPSSVIKSVKDWQNWDPLDKSGKYGPAGLKGSGPYMLDEYRRGEYVMMKRNPHYRMLKEKRR